MTPHLQGSEEKGIYCPRCKKTYTNRNVTIACAVKHVLDTCCHYGQEEIVSKPQGSEKECGYGCGRAWNEEGAIGTGFDDCVSAYHIKKESCEVNDEISAMVRDFTTVTPRSKSEVRSRIEQLLANHKESSSKLAGGEWQQRIKKSGWYPILLEMGERSFDEFMGMIGNIIETEKQNALLTQRKELEEKVKPNHLLVGDVIALPMKNGEYAEVVVTRIYKINEK